MVSLLEELEAREAAARARVEELESQIAELTARLEAEREAWSRLRVTRETVTEVVADMSGSYGAPVAERPVEPMPPAPVRVVGAIMVPHWREGLSVDALPDVYRDIVEVVADVSTPMQAKQIVPRIGCRTFPVPRDGPVGCLQRPLADHDFVLDCPEAPSIGQAAREPSDTSRAQSLSHFAAEFCAALGVKRLVDGLVAYVHVRPVSEASAQSVADLLWAPAQAQVRLDELVQFRVLADLPDLGARPASVSAALGGVGPVVPAAVGQDGAVAADFAAGRRWASAQLGGDRPDGGLLQ